MDVSSATKRNLLQYCRCIVIHCNTAGFGSSLFVNVSETTQIIRPVTTGMVMFVYVITIWEGKKGRERKTLNGGEILCLLT